MISFVWDIILFFSISVYFLGWRQIDFFFLAFANITVKPESLWNVMQSYMFVLENVYTFLQTSSNLSLSSLVLPDPLLNGALYTSKSAALLSFFHVCLLPSGIFQTAVLCPVCQPKPVCALRLLESRGIHYLVDKKCRQTALILLSYISTFNSFDYRSSVNMLKRSIGCQRMYRSY